MSTDYAIIEISNEAAIERLARSLAVHLPTPAVITLDGTLGAGKTRLVQALGTAVGIDREAITSPTYTLMQHYTCRQSNGPRQLNHLDWYRIKDIDELFELGLDEYYDAPDWTLIEWSERFPTALPADRLELRIIVTGAETRRIEIGSHGAVDETLPRRIASDYSAAN